MEENLEKIVTTTDLTSLKQELLKEIETSREKTSSLHSELAQYIFYCELLPIAGALSYSIKEGNFANAALYYLIIKCMFGSMIGTIYLMLSTFAPDL